MNTMVILEEPCISQLQITEDTITAHLTDGRIISVPLAWSWRLTEATPEQRLHYQLIGNSQGVHWPDLDEDISVNGLLQGAHARRVPLLWTR